MVVQNNMRLIHKKDDNLNDSFSLIPLTETCPYLEVSYDIHKECLFLTHRDKKEWFQQKPNSTDITTFDRYYEYSITNKTDIINFIQTFADNVATFSLDKFIKI
jgi:hypothetical protein